MLLDEVDPVVCLIDASASQRADERLHSGRLLLFGGCIETSEEVGHQLRDRLARAPGVRFGPADQMLFEAEGQLGLPSWAERSEDV